VGIVLKNIDCLDLLRSIPDGSIDLMLQDPPYAVTNCDWDKPINLSQMWLEWERVVKPNGAFVFTATQPFTSKLVISREGFFKYCWVWDKKMVSSPANAKIQPLRAHEDIVVFYRSQCTYNPIKRKNVLSPFGKQTATNSKVAGKLGDKGNFGVGYPKSILTFPRPNNLTDGGLHPSQKPIDLMRYLIKTYSNPGETVFDGYSGSGTTAIACIKENRNFIGSELNKEYFDKSMERISHALSKPELYV